MCRLEAYTIKKSREALLVASEQIGLEVNDENLSILACLETSMQEKSQHKNKYKLRFTEL